MFLNTPDTHHTCNYNKLMNGSCFCCGCCCGCCVDVSLSNRSIELSPPEPALLSLLVVTLFTFCKSDGKVAAPDGGPEGVGVPPALIGPLRLGAGECFALELLLLAALMLTFGMERLLPADDGPLPTGAAPQLDERSCTYCSFEGFGTSLSSSSSSLE